MDLTAITATNRVKRPVSIDGRRIPARRHLPGPGNSSAPQPRLTGISEIIILSLSSSWLQSILIPPSCVCAGVQALVLLRISLMVQLLAGPDCIELSSSRTFSTSHEGAKATVPDFRTSQSDPHEQILSQWWDFGPL